MGDIQRYRAGGCGVGCDYFPDPERGPVVMFTDHERVVAEKDARIKELEAAEQRGAERVFGALSPYFAAHPDFERVLADFDDRGFTKEGAADVRGSEAFEAGREAGLKGAKEKAEQILVGHLGKRKLIRPKSVKEWGPVCAGCGADEYRIDGFCSIECRDATDLTIDLLAALSVIDEGKEA